MKLIFSRKISSGIFPEYCKKIHAIPLRLADNLLFRQPCRFNAGERLKSEPFSHSVWNRTSSTIISLSKLRCSLAGRSPSVRPEELAPAWPDLNWHGLTLPGLTWPCTLCLVIVKAYSNFSPRSVIVVADPPFTSSDCCCHSSQWPTIATV